MLVRLALLLFLCLLLAQANSSPSLAQTPIVLTVGLKEWQAMFFGDEVFNAFEEAHPGVQVITVTLENEPLALPENPESVPLFMDNLVVYGSRADLLPISMPGTSPILSRAGLFLDISPLLYADMNANLEDFYPVMLESLQWDAGTWGLPISGSLRFLVYNKTRFDTLGLAYPDESWTIYDWMNAGTILTSYDENGNVAIPGIFGVNDALFLAAEYGESLFDSLTVPAEIQLNEAELIRLVDDWAAFSKSISPASCCNFDWGVLPITGGGIWDTDPNVRTGSNPLDEWALSYYPGGKAGLEVQAYAISSATENPELAYELLKFMTTSPEFLAYNPGEISARQSMSDLIRSSQVAMRPNYTPEIEAMITQGIENAIPASQLESFSYAYMAVAQINNSAGTTTAEQALRAIQEQTLLTFAAVDEMATGRITAAIPTPLPNSVLEAGELSLTFGTDILDTGSWQTAIHSFVEQDPEVAQIELVTSMMGLEERAATQDCFYLSTNPIQGANLSLLRSLDPYLQLDSNYNPSDMLAGTIEQVSYDGMIWGIPLAIEPLMLWYDPQSFEAAALPLPQNNWTISQWEETLHQLYDGSSPVFQSWDAGSTHLFLLAAAYGALPLDYTSSPPTISADIITVDALSSVLNLAKSGLIDYQELANETSTTFIMDGPLVASRQAPGEDYRPVMFPTGVYTPLSYRLSVGMISAQSAVSDACYRWLSFLAQAPELLNGMPARLSMLSNSLAISPQDTELLQLYLDFDAALSSGNAVIIPEAYGGDNISLAIGNSLALYWLHRAFDNYVLHDGNLEADLQEARALQADFATCIAGLPQMGIAEFGDNQEAFEAYHRQFVDCTLAIDPEAEEAFR